MGKISREAQTNSMFMPYNLQLPGASTGFLNPSVINKYGQPITGGALSSGGSAGSSGFIPGVRSAVGGRANYGTPGYAMPGSGTVSGQLDPTMGFLREMLAGSSVGALGQTMNGANGIPSWLGGEFNTANENAPWIGSGPTIPQSMQDQLFGAAGGYLGQAGGAAPFDFNQVMQQQLGLSRAADAPAEQRAMMSNWDSQFGNGILNSTTGGYQTEALANAFNTKDLGRQQNAFTQAMGLGNQYDARQMQQIQQALGLSGAGFQQGADQFGMGLQQNQQGSANVMDRFTRAMQLFGGGQQNQQTNANLALGYLGGVGGIDQQLLNMIQLGGNLGMQRSGANAAAYGFPFQSALQSGQQQGLGSQLLGSLAGGIGKAAGGPIGSAIGTWLTSSDRRLKENIKRVGSTNAGQPLYKYNYKSGGPTHIGVMADESPLEAIGISGDGYLMVDYSKVK